MKHEEIEHLVGFVGEASEVAVDARGLEIAAGCFMAADDLYEKGLNEELKRKAENAWFSLCALNPLWAREICFELLQTEVYADSDAAPIEV